MNLDKKLHTEIVSLLTNNPALMSDGNHLTPYYLYDQAYLKNSPLSLFVSISDDLFNLIADLGVDTSLWIGQLRKVNRDWKPTPYVANPFSDEKPIEQTAWYILQLLALPHISEKNPALIAYHQSVEKLNRDIQTPIKYGRFLVSTAMLPENEINPYVDKFRSITDLSRLQFVENDDLDGWNNVYRSSFITSCMNNDNYGLTSHDTYRCYATAAHGLPSNGLRLAYIVGTNTEDAVARCIVHEPSKTYVRVYGDSLLTTLLEAAGYEYNHKAWNSSDMFLWTDHHPVNGWLSPYVDADGVRFELGLLDGEHILRVSDNGRWSLRNLSGSTDDSVPDNGEEYEGERCVYCGDDGDPDDGSYSAYCVNRLGDASSYDFVCEHCLREHFVWAYHEGGNYQCRESDVIEVGDDYYVNTYDNLDYYEIVRCEREGEYYLRDNVCWSEVQDDYIPDDEAVQIAFLDDDWAHEDDCQEIGDEHLLSEWVERCPLTYYWILSDEAPNDLTLEYVLNLQDLTLDEYNVKKSEMASKLEAAVARLPMKVGDVGRTDADMYKTLWTVEGFYFDKHHQVVARLSYSTENYRPIAEHSWYTSNDWVSDGDVLEVEHDFKVGDIVQHTKTGRLRRVRELHAVNPNYVGLGVYKHNFMKYSDLKRYDEVEKLPFKFGSFYYFSRGNKYMVVDSYYKDISTHEYVVVWVETKYYFLSEEMGWSHVSHEFGPDELVEYPPIFTPTNDEPLKVDDKFGIPVSGCSEPEFEVVELLPNGLVRGVAPTHGGHGIIVNMNQTINVIR